MANKTVLEVARGKIALFVRAYSGDARYASVIAEESLNISFTHEGKVYRIGVYCEEDKKNYKQVIND